LGEHQVERQLGELVDSPEGRKQAGQRVLVVCSGAKR